MKLSAAMFCLVLAFGKNPMMLWSFSTAGVADRSVLCISIIKNWSIMEKQSFKPAQLDGPAPSLDSGREHLGRRLFSSNSWIVYCMLQIMASLALLLFVIVDLESQ
jgi:hypothetical protein